MTTYAELEKAKVHAMKNAPERLTTIRSVINEVQIIAKSDGNRAVVDGDVITAANRVIKKAKETLSFLSEEDERAKALSTEITIASEFLPAQISKEKLVEEIERALVDAPDGKAARGHIMKHLNANFKGQFDGREVNEMISELL